MQKSQTITCPVCEEELSREDTTVRRDGNEQVLYCSDCGVPLNETAFSQE